ncbi:MAG: sensor histidine kinase [Eubacteriales bacterium]|nr:sensor histidine kinase [Eubacteriales bacterium]
MNGKYIRSIRGKILVSILFITLLTSLAVTLIFYGRSARIIEENYMFSLEQRADQLVVDLDEAMERAYHINVYASCDSRIKENIQLYRKKAKDQYLEEVSQILYEYKERSAASSSLYLLIPEKNTVVTSEDYPLYRKEISKQKIQETLQAVKENASPMLLEDLIYDGDMNFSCVESVRDDSGEILGYMISNTDDRKLYYDYIARWKDDAIVESVILDMKKRVIAGSESSHMGENYQQAKQYRQWMKGGTVEGSDSHHIYIYCPSIFSQAALFTVVDKSVVLSDLMWIRWFFFGILAVFLVVALMLALYLSHMIYRPLKQLTSTMEEVSDGNLQTRAQVVSRDEIGELAQEFNGMLDKIEDLIYRLIEEENKKKDMELEALQYQITPHFMYNTLNSIKFAALLKGEKEIGQVIGDFVELLQAAISKKGTFLTVAEEMHILENYIRLQEFRYGGSFEVTYEVDEEAQECLVPRLILQPLVENALLHGMDMKEHTGKLDICAFVTEGQLLLKVTDNGRGMSQAQIEKLLTGKVKKDKGFTAVGIPNIRDRLKLYYGEQGGITYESSEKGTTAMIYLPAKKGEE